MYRWQVQSFSKHIIKTDTMIAVNGGMQNVPTLKIGMQSLLYDKTKSS